MPIPIPHLADHDWASVDTNAHLNRLQKLAASSVQGSDYLQPRVNGPGRIVFMRDRIAKVDQQTIAEILGDIPLVAFDDLGAHLLIGSDDGLEFFGVELF
jgi:hypothetical protein